LELPGAGKDVSDWLSAGGCREELERLAALAHPAGDGSNSEKDAGKNIEDRRLLETETGLAEQFIRDNREDLRFCGPWTKWLAWDGKRWRLDVSGRVQRTLKRTLRNLRV